MIYRRTFDAASGDSLARLSRWIRPGTSVLELGAAAGYFTEWLKEQGTSVDVVDIDPEAGRATERFARRVVIADLDNDGWEAALSEGGAPPRYDFIVCADVLEHLHDPRGALLKLRGRLTPEGRLICSIPNIAFYTVRLKVLLGEFEYTDGGIMDRTHLRFFTHQTARALLEEAGFRVSREEVSHYLSVGPAPLSRALNRLVERGSFGTAVHRVCLAFPGVFGYQFVTESVPSAP